jgi:hypothetical protein
MAFCRERGRLGWSKACGRSLRCDAGGWPENRLSRAGVRGGRSSKLRLYANVFCLVFEKSEKLRTLAVEPAKRLTGADLAGRKSYRLKGPLIPGIPASGMAFWLRAGSPFVLQSSSRS